MEVSSWEHPLQTEVSSWKFKWFSCLMWRGLLHIGRQPAVEHLTPADPRLPNGHPFMGISWNYMRDFPAIFQQFSMTPKRVHCQYPRTDSTFDDLYWPEKSRALVWFFFQVTKA
jgi:hypothetical protein